MKKKLYLLAAVSLVAFGGLTACSQKQQHVDLGDLKNLSDSASYVLGYFTGMNMKSQGMDINPEIFSRAYQQAYSGDTVGVMSNQQMNQVMQKYETEMVNKQRKVAENKAVPNRKAAEAFLAKNKNEKGVITTASGLQYRVEKEGKGPKPSDPNDRVRIQYELRALGSDGKLSQPIENTFERGGDPVIFAMNNLIEGMLEGLSLMSSGAVYEFWIHPDLAYGNQDSPMIPAGSMLVFKVEMVEVLPANK